MKKKASFRITCKNDNEAGFSMMEPLVAGMASTVLAAAVMTVFFIQSRELDQGIGNSFIHGISTVVSEQIGQDIRKANRLLIPGELWQSEGSYPAINTKTLLIYSRNGVILKGYRISAGTLEESVNLADWAGFSVGGTIVKVDSSGYFQLAHDRKEAVLVFQFGMERKNRIFTTVNKMELFRCRN